MQSYNSNPSYLKGQQNVPPSRLGFVCKPDMPPHINILFRARPPLEWAPLPFKGKSRPYEGVVGIMASEILEKFDKNAPEKYIPDDSKRIRRLKSIVESIEKHKQETRDKFKECKYLIYKYLGKRY